MFLSFMRRWRRWHMVFEHLWISAESSVGLCHLEARLPCEFSVSSSCLRCTPPNPLCSSCSPQQPVIVVPSDCFAFPRMSYRWNHPPGSLFRLVAFTWWCAFRGLPCLSVAWWLFGAEYYSTVWWTTVCVSIHLLKDTPVVSRLWQTRGKLTETSVFTAQL